MNQRTAAGFTMNKVCWTTHKGCITLVCWILVVLPSLDIRNGLLLTEAAVVNGTCDSTYSTAPTFYNISNTSQCAANSTRLASCISTRMDCLNSYYPNGSANCSAGIQNCTSQYILCVLNIIWLDSANSSAPALCDEVRLSLKPALLNVAAGAAYAGSSLQLGCFREVCRTYMDRGNAVYTSCPWWVGGETCGSNPIPQLAPIITASPGTPAPPPSNTSAPSTAAPPNTTTTGNPPSPNSTTVAPMTTAPSNSTPTLGPPVPPNTTVAPTSAPGNDTTTVAPSNATNSSAPDTSGPANSTAAPNSTVTTMVPTTTLGPPTSTDAPSSSATTAEPATSTPPTTTSTVSPTGTSGNTTSAPAFWTLLTTLSPPSSTISAAPSTTATFVTTVSPMTSPAPNGTANGAAVGDESILSAPVISGIAVGGAVFLALVILLAFVLIQRSKRKKRFRFSGNFSVEQYLISKKKFDDDSYDDIANVEETEMDPRQKERELEQLHSALLRHHKQKAAGGGGGGSAGRAAGAGSNNTSHTPYPVRSKEALLSGDIL